MWKPILAPLAAAASLALAAVASAASLTPPNLVTASSLNNPDLLLVWPYAAGGPLEAMSWSTFKGQMASGLSGDFLAPTNNLSDLGNPTVARGNLGLGTASTANTGTSGGNLCFLNSVCTHSGEEITAASTSSSAGFNLPPGTAPTSPNNGDVWCTSTSCYFRANGATQNMQGVASASGSLTPTLTYDIPGTSSFSYSSQAGAYVCVGGFVWGNVYVVFTPTNGTASGVLKWNNPPYSINNNQILPISSPLNFSGTWSGLQSLPYFMVSWNSNAFTFQSFSGTTVTQISTSQSSSGSSKTLLWTFGYPTSTGTC